MSKIQMTETSLSSFWFWSFGNLVIWLLFSPPAGGLEFRILNLFEICYLVLGIWNFPARAGALEFNCEARAGFEPAVAVLQTAALPLRHRAMFYFTKLFPKPESYPTHWTILNSNLTFVR